MPSVFSGGITIEGIHSYRDMGHMISSRDTGMPEKKLVTKTVPYMSGFYDFSAIYGGVAFESREVSYAFDILGEDREDLQTQKSALADWLARIHDADIFDDDIPGWHFHGSFSSAEWEEGEEGESGTLEAVFLCHPFLIADEDESVSLPIGTTEVTNDGQPVNPVCIPASGTATITIGGFTQSISSETRLSMQLPAGKSSVKVEGAAVTMKYRRERV